MEPWSPLLIINTSPLRKIRENLITYGSLPLRVHVPVCGPNITTSPPSPPSFTARAAALDTDFGLLFLRVRPPVGELDSVQLVGGGAPLKKG